MPFIFTQHNFVKDFHNASGVGDNFLKQEMIHDQVAKLIFEHKAKVIKALRDHGIKVKAEATSQKIADLIVQNVEYNHPLAEEIKNLIVKYNIPEAEFKNFSSDPKEKQVMSSRIEKGLTEGISAIGVKLNASGSAGEISNGDALKERVNLAEMQSAMLQKEKPGMSTTKKVLIGVGIGVAVTGLIILGVYLWKKKGKMGSGGSVAPSGSPAAPGTAPTSAAPAAVK